VVQHGAHVAVPAGDQQRHAEGSALWGQAGVGKARCTTKRARTQSMLLVLLVLARSLDRPLLYSNAGAACWLKPGSRAYKPHTTYHATAALVIVLPKLQGQVTQRLRARLQRHGLVVREAVRLGRVAGGAARQQDEREQGAKGGTLQEAPPGRGVLTEAAVPRHRHTSSCRALTLALPFSRRPAAAVAPRAEPLQTWVSARAWSINVLASAVRPLIAQPMCSSISATFWMLLGSCGHGAASKAQGMIM
jgi:hypothetical protein